jgi:hypothetical protein
MRLRDTEEILRNLGRLKEQIQAFIAVNHMSDSPISVSVDAMAMNPDGSTLPTDDARYVFVIYGQPLDPRLKCMAFHVIEAHSGNAKDAVQRVIDQASGILAEEQMRVLYVCSDGDAGSNTRHAQFFDNWFQCSLLMVCPRLFRGLMALGIFPWATFSTFGSDFSHDFNHIRWPFLLMRWRNY